jgi:dolichol-phosphate mannosyltransferase
LLVPFGVFAFSSLDHRTKFSWTGPAWLAVIPVLAAQWRYLPGASLVGVKWIRPAQWRAVLIFLAIAFSGGFHYITIGLPGVPYRQRSVKPVAWEEFGHQVQSLAEEFRGDSDWDVYVVSTDRFPMASELAFYRRDGDRGLRTTRPAHFYGGHGVMYEHWFPDPPPADILMLFVSFREDAIRDPKIVAHVRELGAVKRGQVMKRGKPAGRFYYRTGRGYVRSTD